MRVRRAPAAVLAAAALAALCAADPCVTQLREKSQARRNPYIGTTITRANATRLIAEAARRPRQKTYKELGCDWPQVLYLALGVPGDGGTTVAPWYGQGSGGMLAQIIRFSVDEEVPGAVHFRGRTDAERRNVMYAVALDQERRQGWAWDWLIFISQAVHFHRGNLRSFEAFLAEHRPAVGVPVDHRSCRRQYGPSGLWEPVCMQAVDGRQIFSTSNWGNGMVAYHLETRSTLWPLDAELDHEACEEGARWGQVVRAQTLFKGSVVVDSGTAIELRDARRQTRGCQTWHYTCASAHVLSGPGARRAAPIIGSTLRVDYAPITPALTVHCFRPHPGSCLPPDLSEVGGTDFRRTQGGRAALRCIVDISRLLGHAEGSAVHKDGVADQHSVTDECLPVARPMCVGSELLENETRPVRRHCAHPPRWPPAECPCDVVCRPSDAACRELCSRPRMPQGVPGAESVLPPLTGPASHFRSGLGLPRRPPAGRHLAPRGPGPPEPRRRRNR